MRGVQLELSQKCVVLQSHTLPPCIVGHAQPVPAPVEHVKFLNGSHEDDVHEVPPYVWNVTRKEKMFIFI